MGDHLPIDGLWDPQRAITGRLEFTGDRLRDASRLVVELSCPDADPSEGSRQIRRACVLGAHTEVQPPSTASTWPVTKLLAGLARNTSAPSSSVG